MLYATIAHNDPATKNNGNPYLLISMLEASNNAPAIPKAVPIQRAIAKYFVII